jgi:carboxymethylenebutenolidase
VTREAAFARRAKLRDRTYVGAIESFARQHETTGVVGFCLGWLYAFELARRGLPAMLASLYGFPQGMPAAEFGEATEFAASQIPRRSGV